MRVRFGWNEIFGMGAVLGFCLIPVVAATILSFRSYRRRFWLGAPGLLFVILAVLMFFVFDRFTTGDETPAFLIAMSMLFGSWIATGLFLTALAIAGPKLPVLDVREVF